MSYDHFITLAVPVAQREVSQRIAKAMEPTNGGIYAFSITAEDASHVQYAVYGFPCTSEFAGQIEYFKLDSSLLYQAIAYDYATRWDEPVCPVSAAEVQQFVDTVLISTAPSVASGMSELGLITISESQ